MLRSSLIALLLVASSPVLAFDLPLLTFPQPAQTATATSTSTATGK